MFTLFLKSFFYFSICKISNILITTHVETVVVFYASDASDFMLKSKETKAKYDVVFVDPPRKGLNHQFIRSLLIITPTKIVYVSCDPSALARDVAALSEVYEVKTVSAVDMFPMTFHVEQLFCCLKSN